MHRGKFLERGDGMPILCSSRPKALIHYSDAPIGIFNVPKGHFKTATQGRVYALDLSNTRKFSVTKNISVSSALVFTGQAADMFVLHPPFTIFFFKSLLGQYRTKRFGDLEWDQADTECAGDVLHIKKVNVIQIPDAKRDFRQKRNVALAVCLDVMVALMIVLAISVPAPAERLGLGQWTIDGPWWKITVALIAVLVAAAIILSIQSSKKLAAKDFSADLRRLGF